MPTADSDSQLPLDLGALTSTAPTGKAARKRKQDLALSAPGRVERVTSREAFTRAIFAVGGNEKTIQFASGLLYRIAFDLSAKKLYQYFGVSDGNRDGLPEIVQNVVMIHELLNAAAIRKLVIPVATEQADINNIVYATVRRQSHATERFLISVNLFTRSERLLQDPDQAQLPTPPITLDTEYGPMSVEVVEVFNESDIPF